MKPLILVILILIIIKISDPVFGQDSISETRIEVKSEAISNSSNDGQAVSVSKSTVIINNGQTEGKVEVVTNDEKKTLEITKPGSYVLESKSDTTTKTAEINSNKIILNPTKKLIPTMINSQSSDLSGLKIKPVNFFLRRLFSFFLEQFF